MTCNTLFCLIQTVLNWFKLYLTNSTCIWSSHPVLVWPNLFLCSIQPVFDWFDLYSINSNCILFDLTCILPLWLELDWFSMYCVDSTCACPIQHAFDPCIQYPINSACIWLILLYFNIFCLNMNDHDSTYIWSIQHIYDTVESVWTFFCLI